MTPAKTRRAPSRPLADHQSVPEPIAIVGAACRFPGAPDLAAFWSLLEEGRDAVSTLPADRFNQDWFLHPRRGEPGRSYTFAAGHLGDITGFDAGHFGLSPREVAEADPQQRLLLEVAHEALEDAGWAPASVAGRSIGVFVGGSSTDYAELRLSDPAGADRYFMTGNTLSILGNRITNIFDLHGGAQTVDTACSSSLVALSLAVESLRAGRVEAALVGGVQLLLSPYAFTGFSRAAMLSPTGRCHAFDAAADGYVRGEGAGMVVLKPLSAALAAGDAVRAVILSAGVNAVGRSIGLSLPDPQAQAALLREVLAQSGLSAADVTYFEAHGTGTQAGDPVEAAAIGQVLSEGRGAPLPVGSVKTNIGHLETASGMAGLIKAVLMLEHRVIPPNLHFTRPNPRIDLDALHLRVPTAAEPLPGRRPVIGVNSFGFGGTNASLLLAAPPPARPATARAAPAGTASLPPLLLSARSAEALSLAATSWSAALRAAPGQAPALLRGLARHRDLAPHRLVLRGANAAALADGLDAFAAGEHAGVHGTASPRAPEGGDQGGIAFAFSGNGSQFPGMAREAMAHSRPFRAAVEAADAELTPRLGWSVAAALADGLTAEALAATEVAQPALFAVQHGLVAALAAEGIAPGLVLGHSVGEVAAALAAGILDLPEAARLIVARSAAQARTRGRGRMAALNATEEEAAPLLAECGPGLEIAARNAPRALTVAGPAEAVARLAAAARRERLTLIALDLDYAFHSAAMDEVREVLAASLEGLRPTAPRLPFLSTVTGAVLATPADAAYWWRNLRAPVRFAEAAAEAGRLGARLVLEIGPNPILQSYLREALRAAKAEAPVLAGLSKRDAPGDPIPLIADRAVSQGADPRGAPAFQGPAMRRGLPATPYVRARAWFPATGENMHLHDPVLDHPLLGFRREAAPAEAGFAQWMRHLDTALLPWLADHRLGDEAVMPAAGMAEMALAAAALRFPEAEALELSGFQILRPLPVPAGDSGGDSQEIRFRLAEDGTCRLESRRRLSGEGWSLHARGLVRAADLTALPEAALTAPGGGRRIEEATIHAAAARCGLDYGPAFRPVRHVDLAPEGLAAEVALGLPAEAPADAGFLLHPVRLDGAMQGLIGLLADAGGGPSSGEGLVPVRFERLVLRRGAAPAARAAIALTHAGTRAAEARMVLADAAGRPVAVAEGVWFQRARFGRPEAAEAAPFRLEDRPAADPALPAPEPALAAALAAAEARDAALDLSEPALLLEAYIAAAVARALAAEAEGGPVIPANPYAAAMLRALEEDGLAAREGGGWRLLPVGDLPAPEDIWLSVLMERPVLAQDLAALALAAERLPDALAGRLSTGEPRPLLSDEAAARDRLAQVLADAAGAIAAAWPADRPLRVLDLGGPGLTRHLSAILRRSGRRILHVMAGEVRSAPPAQEMAEVTVLDWNPAGGTPAPVVVDLVVGMNQAAIGQTGTPLLATLSGALAEGGALLLAEPQPGRMIEFLDGQNTAYWSRSPLPGAAAWRGALEADGWLAAQVEPLRASPIPALLVAARRPVPASAAPAAAPGRRLVVLADAGAAALGEALAAALLAAGATAEAHRLEDAAALPPRALREAGVIALANPLPAALATTLAGITRLAEAASGAASGFTLVAQGGAATPAAEAVRALGRVLANEMPDLAPRRILVDAALAPAAAATRLLPELLAPGEEPELVLGLAARRVPRLVQGAAPAPTGPGPAVRLAVQQPGALASLGWEPMGALPVPGPGEVRLRVEAAGLNFRDLMWAQGLLPEETLKDGFAGAGLGMECAGVVEAAGPGVPFHQGTRVFGFAPRALASRALTLATALAPIPEGMNFTAAATIPVAFLTAVYALETCARLGPGERVLIHGGAGAVGLAALQVAQAAGAEVAMTAGTEAKRAFLRAAGATLVLDSRAAGFDDALRRTWPEGVDVVLNSLAGEGMERSLALVRPFGRFVELGKRDYAEDRRIAVRPFRRNVTYFGVDVDQLPKARPAEAARLLESIRGRLASGDLRSLPYTCRGAEEAEGAFRLLQASGHIGKIVVIPPRGDAPAPAAWEPGSGTVVVTGGTSGFGLECAKWLAARGTGRIALLSRRGAVAPGVGEAITALAALGARASAHAVDAADSEALAALLDALRAEGPVTGVVHAAAVFDDGAATAMDAARYTRSLAPKLTAAENLDRLTAEDPLRLFLLFSSATTALGNPGQANYVAANAGLEALARRRAARGRPALAVGWGPILDAGVLAREAETARTLTRRLGVEPMTARASLDALPGLLAGGAPVVSLARIAWKRAGTALPVLREPAFAALRGRAEETDAGIADMRAHLAALPPGEAQAMLVRIGAEELGRILRLPPESIAPDAPVARLGLDSLGGLELRGALEARLGMPVPLSAVTEDLTVAGLAARMVDGLSGSAREAQIDTLLDHFEPGAPPPMTPEPTPVDALAGGLANDSTALPDGPGVSNSGSPEETPA